MVSVTAEIYSVCSGSVRGPDARPKMVLTQLSAAACRDLPDMERQFADGDFTKAVRILDDLKTKDQAKR
jgi:hypothetical protein